jgi:diguanylate cyclase (GGDEF)-like protein
MDKAREGDFFAWAEKKTSDELGKAADSFNYLMERIRTLTFFDSLTNLPNYEQFKYWFAQSAKERDLSEKSYSFVLLSVNGFKKVNEAYGVEAGDQILIQVATRLKNFKKRFPALLYFSRFSGDEFLLFYKDIENKNALEQEILSLLKNLNAPYLYKGNNIYIRFVAGGAFCEECYKNLDVQMSAASNARSIAKKRGQRLFYCRQ